MSDVHESIDLHNLDQNVYPDLFNDDFNKTSATDFFNRTNGLGSPDFYLQKRLKEQEEKENAVLKNRRPSRNRSSFAQPKTANSVADVKPAPKIRSSIDEQNEEKQREDLRRRFSGANMGPIALPEHPNERRSSFATGKPSSNRPTPTTSPVKTRRVSGVVKPPAVRSTSNINIEKRASEIVKQPIVRPATEATEKSKRVSAVTKPSAIVRPTSTPTKSNKVVEVSKKPVAVSKPAVVSKPIQVSKPEPPKVKRVSEVAKPVVSRPLSGIPNPLKSKTAVQRPVILPDRPENDQIPAGPMTRARDKERRRGSFMMPTQSSLRRSVSFIRPGSKIEQNK
ncbi:hypothetical protein M3Y97_00459400 [Aphelenchoides bicaudatus]|nr:hypothetical protein M3Y97_00459400 [Aphelenchoides bicaudatus]